MSNILISDYDKTLFTTINELYLNLQAIEEFRNNGNKFVIATARSFQSIENERIIHDIPVDYLICNCGNAIYNNKGTCLNAHYIDFQTIENIVNYLNLNNLLDKSNFYDERGINNNSFDIIEINTYEVPFLKLQSLVHYIHRNYPRLYIYHYKSNNIFLSNRINKADAVSLLLKLIDEEFDNIITVGDNKNDYQMIKKYNGYRMNDSSFGLKLKYNRKTSNVRELIK